jgi:Superinfection immunity protein
VGSMNETSNGIVFLVFAILLGIFVYFIPVLTALRRGHRAATSIFVVNLFLGWTFVGWVICLAWAYSPGVKPLEERGRIVQYLEQKEETGAGPRNALVIGLILAALVGVAIYLDKTNISARNSTAAARQRPEFATYTNARFGFTIEYPRSFAAKQPPENGDGITFVSSDGAASLAVAGGNNDGFTLREYYEMSLKSVGESLGDQGRLGYRKTGGTWFVITWRDKDTLGYLKMFVGKGSQNSFTFIFPESQRAQYDAVTSRIEKSFRPGQLDQAW